MTSALMKMRRLTPAALALTALASLGTIGAQAISPPPGLAVRVVKQSAPDGARLVITREGVQRGSITMPPGLSASDIDEGVRRALWHPNGRDVALGFKSPKASFVVVFLEQASGSYLAADVSMVEGVNIGGIGPFRAYKDRRTDPIEWLPLNRIDATGSRYNGAEAVQVRLRTQVWDLNGTRYQGAEPLIILRDGTALWR
jgi:hypothetical protein